jgi:hypothetical protein
MLPISNAPTKSFQAHYKESVLALRNALAEGLIAAGADPARPQDAARDLGINRNLTWKLSRLIAAHDLEAAFSKVPGPGAVKILVRALEAKGAPPTALERINQTFVAFERMVAEHASDRSTLELMLDSSAAAGTEPLELSRKLAFQGNSGIWGCQARVRVRAVFLAPNEGDPRQLDIAQISGLVDLVRFRPDAIWPLFQRISFADDGTPLDHSSHAREERIHFTEDPSGEGPPLLRHFCSANLPEVVVEETPSGFTYSFGKGPVGNTGKLTLLYGSGTRRFAPRFRDSRNEWAETFINVNAPAESLLMDFFIHESLRDEVQLEPKLLLGSSEANFLRHSIELPCPEPVRELGSNPPLVSTPLMPRHGELVGEVFGHMGWSPAEFTGFRLEIKHPPTPSTAMLRYRLPSAP